MRRMFHGGAPGLAVGDLVLPPTVTGRVVIKSAQHDRADRVYITDDLPRAAMFAASARWTLWGDRVGTVYEVEPLGPLEEDPCAFADYVTDLIFASTLPPAARPMTDRGAWRTTSARVVRVLATDVALSEPAADALSEAIDMVKALAEVDDQPHWRQFLSTLHLDGEVSARDRVAAEMGWPPLASRPPTGNVPGRGPCRPGNEHWGVCGGAELRWVPAALGGLRGTPCDVPHEQDGDGWTTCEQGHKHWGCFGAAGVLVVTLEQEPRVLLQHRAEWSDGGGTWALPGGARMGEESAQDAAAREVWEETGIDPDALRVLGEHVEDHGGWSYTTFITTAPGPLPVTADHESIELRWVPVEQVEALPLLPALRAAWPLLVPC